MNATIGVIGGSGLYEIEGLTNIQELEVNTPFGKPSDKITVGLLGGKKIAFLPRHGKGHRIIPSELPTRANVYALKSIGVEWIISINSAGSLKEEIHPGEMVVPDQLIDRTVKRESTFFGRGIVAHVAFSDPFCPILSDILYRAAAGQGVKTHKGGDFVVMEGPQFSTRAESNLYRSWGASLIGMTVLPEAKLAREAEICYASLALVTDYDCWHETCEPVTIGVVLATMQQNVANARRIISAAAAAIPGRRDCSCAEALKTAIVTAPDMMPEQVKRDLSLLLGKYFPVSSPEQKH
ncbi:MAG: S-methyl-5'-thioadenosine phosphorylase [Chloroflexi bacterium]|nr:S-methyl-5'-thioadenosine phosphorylase [Chloroflexota bacterium]